MQILKKFQSKIVFVRLPKVLYMQDCFSRELSVIKFMPNWQQYFKASFQVALR